jgi:hypothetical protein
MMKYLRHLIKSEKSGVEYYKAVLKRIPKHWRSGFCDCLGYCSVCNKKTVVYYEVGSDIPFCHDCHNFPPEIPTWAWGNLYDNYRGLLWNYEQLVKELNGEIEPRYVPPEKKVDE